MPPTKYFENTVHPERDFEMDKFDCGTTADSRAALTYPTVTTANMNFYRLLRESYFNQCLSSRGWTEVTSKKEGRRIDISAGRTAPALSNPASREELASWFKSYMPVLGETKWSTGDIRVESAALTGCELTVVVRWALRSGTSISPNVIPLASVDFEATEIKEAGVSVKTKFGAEVMRELSMPGKENLRSTVLIPAVSLGAGSQIKAALQQAANHCQ